MPTDDKDGAFAVSSMKQVLDRRVFAPDSKIFTEGDTSGNAYILLRGDVTIYTGFGTADQQRLMNLKPGQMFGELGIMADEKRTASAHTEKGCELLTISKSKLEAKLNAADPFLKYWIEYLSKRVIDLTSSKNVG